MRYRAADPATLIRIDLPPFTALFHRPSGTTHLLVEPAPELLEALAAGPLSADELRARLTVQFDLDDEAALADRLGELVAAGLIETP